MPLIQYKENALLKKAFVYIYFGIIASYEFLVACNR